MSGLTLTPLDGADSIGGSKLLLEYDGLGILLDFGMNFARTNRYFEEYLRPRTTTGLLDHIIMGTVPDVKGLYRKDLMHPDLELKGREVKRVDAVLLSHGHLDHSGDIGFLRRDIPVATSAMTAAIAKAAQDSSRSEPGREPVYISERCEDETRGAKLLRSSRGNLLGRDYALLDQAPTKELQWFWGFLPSSELSKRANTPKLVPGGLCHGLDDVECRMMPVDHSIKGASAFILKTSQGNIVYTGDLRMHGLRNQMTRDFVAAARAAKPYLLVTEGTRVRKDGADDESNRSKATEEDVRETADKIMSTVNGKFAIADFGPRNVERLEIFLEVSLKAHRKLVVTTKDAYLLYAMHMVDATVPVPGDDMLVYNSPKGSTDKYEEWILDHEYPDSLVRPTEIHESPGDYLLSFSFWDMKHLIDIKPSDGHYVYSSSEAHNEEQAIDFLRLGEWLMRFNITPHGFRIEDDGDKKEPVFESQDGPLHASGHASPEDLKDIVREIDPEVLVPVHTEYHKWFDDTFGGERKVIIPQRYEAIDL
ncbi:MAG TPA: MBL fold metallo-hydrolase [Thermoplasmata archaeon]|nr:MBL fold metallo-hydrolase [Thermoplasmata archaeon]